MIWVESQVLAIFYFIIIIIIIILLFLWHLLLMRCFIFEFKDV